MIFRIPYLASCISQYFTFQPGDLLMTGTPPGAGPVSRGDRLRFGGESIEPVAVTVQQVLREVLNSRAWIAL